MAHVIINDTDPSISYAVTGAQSVFVIPAEIGFFALTDIKVFNGDAELTYDVAPADATEFSVTGLPVDGGYQGGIVTLGATVTNTVIKILRDVPIARTSDFPSGNTLNITALNTQLDVIAAWMQQQNTRWLRALRLADSDPTSGLTLPQPAERANCLLGFGADGAAIVVSGVTPGTVTVSTFMATVLDDLDEAAARATLNAAARTGDETLTGNKTFSGNIVLEGAVALSGDISISITANQNDWNPTGLSGASTIRLTTDAARSVTGLQGGADGRLVAIQNVGTQNALFTNEDSGSTAANRFSLPYDKITLLPGQAAVFRYDATGSRWRLVSVPSYEHLLIYEDQKSDGTVGGTATTGAWTKHTLNTEVADTGAHGSLSSSVIALEAGTYDVVTETIYGNLVGGFRSRFRNTSDGIDQALSLTGGAGNTSTNISNWMITGRGRFTIAAAKNFELQYFAQGTSSTSDLGAHDGVTAGVEVYARVTLRKVA